MELSKIVGHFDLSGTAGALAIEAILVFMASKTLAVILTTPVC